MHVNEPSRKSSINQPMLLTKQWKQVYSGRGELAEKILWWHMTLIIISQESVTDQTCWSYLWFSSSLQLLSLTWRNHREYLSIVSNVTMQTVLAGGNPSSSLSLHPPPPPPCPPTPSAGPPPPPWLLAQAGRRGRLRARGHWTRTFPWLLPPLRGRRKNIKK